jgi:hypothetical protein
MDDLSIVSVPRESIRNKILWEQWIKNTLISHSFMRSKSLNEVWIFCKEPLSDQTFGNLGISVKFWRNSFLMIQAILNSSKSSNLPALVLSIEVSEPSLSSKIESLDSLGQTQLSRDLGYNEFQFAKWQKEIRDILNNSQGFLVQDVSDNFLNLNRIQNQWIQKLTPKLLHGGKYGFPYVSISILRFENWSASFDPIETIAFEDWSSPSFSWEFLARSSQIISSKSQYWCALKSAGVSRFISTMIMSRKGNEDKDIYDFSAFWGCCELRDFLCFCYLAQKGAGFLFLDAMDNLRMLRKSSLEG